MSKVGDKPAFPQVRDHQGEWPGQFGLGGLTERELFTALALNGILAHAGLELLEERRAKWRALAAREAMAHADALLAALGERDGEP